MEAGFCVSVVGLLQTMCRKSNNDPNGNALMWANWYEWAWQMYMSMYMNLLVLTGSCVIALVFFRKKNIEWRYCAPCIDLYVETCIDHVSNHVWIFY